MTHVYIRVEVTGYAFELLQASENTVEVNEHLVQMGLGNNQYVQFWSDDVR